MNPVFWGGDDPVGGGGYPLNSMASAIYDFARNRYYTRNAALNTGWTESSFASLFTYTGSNGTRVNASGLIEAAVTNQPRFDYDPVTLAPKGILIEEARTNVALHNRDLTQAAWTAVNVTAAKTQIGTGGVANSCSLITATSNAGTILQTVVLASSTRLQSAYIKRVSGSGTLEMTTDGVTYTDITAQLTGLGPNGFAACALAAQAAVVNPIFGFRIGTSGDSFAVDYTQNENGSFRTSAIPTTSAAVTRTADVCTRTMGAEFNAAASSFVVAFTALNATPSSGDQIYVSFNDGTITNRFNATRQAGTNNGQIGVTMGGVGQAGGGSQNLVTLSNGINAKLALALTTNDYAACGNGGTVNTDAVVTINAVTNLDIGRNVSDSYANGHIKQLIYYPSRLSNAQLQSIST